MISESSFSCLRKCRGCRRHSGRGPCTMGQGTPAVPLPLKCFKVFILRVGGICSQESSCPSGKISAVSEQLRPCLCLFLPHGIWSIVLMSSGLCSPANFSGQSNYTHLFSIFSSFSVYQYYPFKIWDDCWYSQKKNKQTNNNSNQNQTKPKQNTTPPWTGKQSLNRKLILRHILLLSALKEEPSPCRVWPVIRNFPSQGSFSW